MKYQRLESSSSSHDESELSTEIVSISNPIQLAEQQPQKSLFIKVLLREIIYEIRECHVDSSVADLKSYLASKSLVPEIRQRLIYNGFSHTHIYLYIHAHTHTHPFSHSISLPLSRARFLSRYLFSCNFISSFHTLSHVIVLLHLNILSQKGKPLLPNNKTIGSFGIGDNCCIHLFPIPEARAVIEPSNSTGLSSIQSTPTNESSNNPSFLDSFSTFQPVIYLSSVTTNLFSSSLFIIPLYVKIVFFISSLCRRCIILCTLIYLYGCRVQRSEGGVCCSFSYLQQLC